jgi:hypothetical protein
MNLPEFKPFKQYSFYDDSIYNQIFENVTPLKTREPTVLSIARGRRGGN